MKQIRILLSQEEEKTQKHIAVAQDAKSKLRAIHREQKNLKLQEYNKNEEEFRIKSFENEREKRDLIEKDALKAAL